MRDWKEKLDAFLKFNEQDVLRDTGSVSMEIAQALALEEYEKFSALRIAKESAEPDPEFESAAKKIEQKSRSEKLSR